MIFAKLGAAFVAGAISFAAFHSAALAASPATDVFLANLAPNVDFLDQSSRFALTNSKNARVHDFALVQAREQTLAANAIDEWRQGNAAGSQPGRQASGDGPLLTGRSAAVEGRSAAVADQRMPMGQEDLDSLEGLSGGDFDEQYRVKQRDALRQVEADYQDYIARGDDPMLLALASRELPKVRQRLMLLGRI